MGSKKGERHVEEAETRSREQYIKKKKTEEAGGGDQNAWKSINGGHR